MKLSTGIFGLGCSKTGLGGRIALLLIRTMGRRTLGLGYAIALADLALAPFMPSNTARSGGTIYPAIRKIPEMYGSHPHDDSARKIGAYLMYTALAATCVTASMFLTALGPNILAMGLVSSATQTTVSWMDWFIGFAPAGVLLLALVREDSRSFSFGLGSAARLHAGADGDSYDLRDRAGANLLRQRLHPR